MGVSALGYVALNVSQPAKWVEFATGLFGVQVLKRAMGVQCRGAFDKREPEDIAALLRTIAEEASRDVPGTVEKEPRRRGLLGELASLIGEWNRRMAAEQSR